MPAKLIEAPDLTGYDLMMEGLIVDSHTDGAEKKRMLAMLKNFTAWARQLDQWRLKHIKAREFGPGEPCFHGDVPCVVMGSTIQRVTVRRWAIPSVTSPTPLVGEVKWYQGRALTKVSKRDQFEQWVWSMFQSGHRSEHWSTVELLAVAK